MLLSSAVAQEKVAKIDALVNAYAKENQFSGVALVAQEGKIIYHKAVGLANTKHIGH